MVCDQDGVLFINIANYIYIYIYVMQMEENSGAVIVPL